MKLKIYDAKGERCCYTCQHDIRTGTLGNIKNHCEVDGHYITYVDCFADCCRRYSANKGKEIEEQENE